MISGLRLFRLVALEPHTSCAIRSVLSSSLDVDNIPQSCCALASTTVDSKRETIARDITCHERRAYRDRIWSVAVTGTQPFRASGITTMKLCNGNDISW